MTAVVPELDATAAERGFRWDWVTWAVLGVLALFIGVAFSPAVKASFVDLDDQMYVFGNGEVLRGMSPHGVKWAMTTRWDGRYMPMTWLSLQMDATISRVLGLESEPAGAGDRLPDAVVYHVTNIVLHVGATWMLFFFLYRATKQRWASFVIALLWCVHPLRVESVAWVTERKDELAGLFGFLAMYWYVIGKEAGRSTYWFWGATAALVLSMWAKSMFVVMPVLLMIVDYWPLGRIRNVREGVRSAVEKWPMWVVAILGAAGTAYIGRYSNGTLGNGRLDDAKNAILSYVRYLVMQVDFRGMAPFYPYVGSPTGLVCGALVLLAVITAVAVLLRKKYPWVFAGWVWYVVASLPTIGFFQSFTQAYADRFSYLPVVGLLGMVVYSAFQWRRATMGLVAGAVCVAVVLGVFSYRQTEYWRDSVTLFERAREVTPMSQELHWSLAHAYARVKRLDEAEQECKALVSAYPDFDEPHWLLTWIYQKEDRLDLALAEARKAVEMAPEKGEAWRNYALVLVQLGRYEEALEPLKKANEKMPGDASVEAALQRVREMLPPGVH